MIRGRATLSSIVLKDLLLPFRTIEDNVALPLIMHGMKKKEARKKVSPYFEEFGLEGTQKDYPAQLSGGMRQRAALLRTYMFSKDVALLDEPFSALDTFTKSQMHEWYLTVMDKIRLTTLFVTHDIDEAILLSDRIYLLTGKPGVIEDEIIIDEPRPRDEKFMLSPAFIEYKKKILSIL
jgi:ABC-type nitrate/sulfonate/bicarbonate transport system ATPase subunit